MGDNKKDKNYGCIYMSEITKELSRAKANEDAGELDKAARNYFSAAKLTNDLKLFNKAFFTARKSGSTDLMFQTGKSYYDILEMENQADKIKELIPTFLDISGRERDRLADSPDKIPEVLGWTTTLYQLVGKTDAAYDISLETGDVYFSLGQKILATTYRLGKEEKWQRGLDLFDKSVEAFQQIRLDVQSLERILEVKLDKISKLIDIGRHAEGIENTTSLMSYYRSQSQEIVPFSDDALSLRIAEIFSENTLIAARDKKFNIADVLMKTTKAGFENAGKKTEIAPFLWQLALIYDENNQKELFFALVETTFETALKNSDDLVQKSILNYLDERAKNICENIISSRLLMVKKSQIEFQNNEGVQYLLKSMDLAKIIDNNEIPENALQFLFQYGQNMYAKKHSKRSLPYFEFCAQNWWSLHKDPSKPHEIIGFIEAKYEALISVGKFDDASHHLGSIISIQIIIEDFESAGNSAFMFAKAAGEKLKQDIELEFLEQAYEAFVGVKATNKLQEVLIYITQQMDPLFNLDSKSQELREKFIHLGDIVAAAISEDTQGEFLKGTTFKSINSGLIESGIDIADKAFEIVKKYDPREAADIYYKVGTFLLKPDMEKALDFIVKSTKYSVEHESLKDLVDRNFNYLIEGALETTVLDEKLLIAEKLELLTEITKRVETFNEFLFTFTQNLAEKDEQINFYNETKNFLAKAFHGFYDQDPKHQKLSEIITWTNNRILEVYTDTQNNQKYELAINTLAFHKKLDQIQEYIPFFWNLFNEFVSLEDFSHAIEYFKQTYQTIIKTEQPEEFTKDFTGQVVSSIDRGIKPKIADEKFDEAFPLIEGLFTILNESGLSAQAVDLYEANSKHFAPHRLDLALTMWSQAIDKAKEINDTEAINSMVKTIYEDILPIYIEKGISGAVNQLYSEAASAYSALGDTSAMLKVLLDVTRYNLSTSDFEAVYQSGKKGFELAIQTKAEDSLFEFSNMFFAVGSGLLTEDPETGVKLIKVASDHLRDFGPSGFDHYCIKMAEIYDVLYNTPLTQQVAQNEREKLLQHFKESGKRKEEGNFLVTTAKLSFQAGNVTEGLDLISQGTNILKELEDEDGLSDVVSVCLKAASGYRVGTDEYIALSRHATSIQETTSVEISDEKTQEAFGDLFDGLLDDMTSLMDPKERERRKKEKK